MLHTIRKFELDFVLNRLSIHKESKILDFGAGDGFIISQFQAKGFKNILGVEIEGSNYSNQTNFKILYYSGLIEEFPNMERPDIIYSSNVLEHVDDIEKYLTHFNHILSDGGIQIHIVPTHYWKLYNSIFYYYKVLLFLFNRLGTKKNVKSTSYKEGQKKNFKESKFFIGRHGSRGNTFDEFTLFHPKSYQKIFDKNEISYENFKIPLIYSGHNVFGKILSLKTRRILSKIFGYSCHCFIINKFQ